MSKTVVKEVLGQPNFSGLGLDQRISSILAISGGDRGGCGRVAISNHQPSLYIEGILPYAKSILVGGPVF